MEQENSSKILIVDDEPDVEVLMNQRFRRELREKKFTFSFARSGVEALEVLSKDPDIRLVISDINMPEMDGLTLLKNIGEKYPLVIPIIVSAYGDMNNIRQAMNLGAFDFVTKPINFEDLTVTIDKTLHHIQYLLEAQKTKNKLEGILHELNVASEIQQSILPRNFINDDKIDMFAKMTAAKEIGGDFYDFFWLDPEKTKLAFVIADVSGKGVPAALFMTVSRTLIRAHAYNANNSPGSCLTKVNTILHRDNTNMMFVTTFYAVLDVTTGKVDFCNAGHNHPFVIRKGGGIEPLKKTHGMALGVMDEIDYKEDQVTLSEGDALFLYTDGVTEAEQKDGSLFGEARLSEKLQQYQNLAASELINTLKQDITDFAQGWPQSDDITMLALRYLVSNQ